MASDPSDPRGALPDFSAPGDPAALPDLQHARASENPFAADDAARSRTRTTIIAVIAGAVVLLSIAALVLWQTVLRDPSPEDLVVSGSAPTSRDVGESGGEYIPDPNDPDIAPPPPIFTETPTTSCYVPEYETAGSDSGSDVRGGHLQYTRPDRWNNPWSTGVLPFMTDVNGWGRNVEGSWYSVVNVGALDWPDDVDGGYPGMEEAAVAVFQCYATTSGVRQGFGEHPTITDYRSEATTVDGHPAWIVQATYHFTDPDYLSSSSASIVTSIVVETDDGPQALASDCAADVPAHVEDLEEIIASLKVV
ncbi:hypothetical protein Bequi_06255 [Brachybacterium sp. JHP9]|uniref:PknH-like extracellular domain-containing protein n=1 Tax=Brachybacterium equifaecis TaxID=2910770 RepID=A0ABT0QZN8_9MICO|nr:hypothetical protein [Brachybacterium equifaecis]MCL6422994.1 hypothetical protein [Brachybacterium equifaecis]